MLRSSTPPPRVFLWGLLVLQALSFALHFYGLSRFNTLVFDETAYARFGHNYLNGLAVFDVHPPLGKLLIGAGMWLGDLMGYAGESTNLLSGAERAPWAYRWVAALFGSTLAVLLAGITWELFHRWRMALLSGLLMLLSGIFLVEARYALINVFVVTFGLFGHWLWLRSLSARTATRRHLLWLLSGLALGCCISVKWSGLSFLGVVWATTLLGWLTTKRTSTQNRFFAMPWLALLSYFVVAPTLLYATQWTPHLLVSNKTLSQEHTEMLRYHQSVKDDKSEHPYCSRWTTWPFMLRPISLVYETQSERPTEAATGAATAQVPVPVTVRAVHEIINPLLAWCACVAMLWVAAAFAFKWERLALSGTPEPDHLRDVWTLGYVLLGFLSGWLPWAMVGRCQFLYLYMPSLAFALIASAWAVDYLLAHPLGAMRWTGYSVVLGVAGSFLFFLPIYLGWPISQAAFYARMWLVSWI
jgi:dolichyl-phosphate-mannose-protein mannosyltransferase